MRTRPEDARTLVTPGEERELTFEDLTRATTELMREYYDNGDMTEEVFLGRMETIAKQMDRLRGGREMEEAA